jgi:vacuolar-type H+-ATPase subunit I/STV1
MRYYLCFLVVAIVLTSCKQESPQTSPESAGKIAQLESELSQLALDTELKDSMINESLAFFNEIQHNLEAIGVKKDEIRIKTDNPALAANDKQWILSEIRHINYLREDNAKKVNQLRDQLKKNNMHILDLDEMIERLVREIDLKDEQIASLQDELNRVDKEYARLFDAYQEKAVEVSELTDELNTAYFTYGTEKELKNNHVIEQRNGFLGLGKKNALVDQFNEKYFTRINITERTEILIEGLDIKLISDHPSVSYDLVPSGKNTKLKISNPREFWKVTKYLVVVVD